MRQNTDPKTQGSSTVTGGRPASGILRVVVLYATFASLWIIVSDELLTHFFSDPVVITMISTLKGWMFVGVTSLLLFGLGRSWHRQLLHEVMTRAEQERAIDALQERFRVVLEQAGDAIWLAGPDKRFTFVNAAASLLTGYRPEELLDMPYTDLLPDEEREELPHHMELLGREPFIRREWTLKRKDGSPISVELTTQRLENGGFFAVGRDLTEKKRAQEEREMTVEFLRLVNESRRKEEMIRATATFFQERTGCEAVGIRLREDDDYPYFEARGFPADFVRSENSLCSRDSEGKPVLDSIGNPVLACMCGNVICGRFDPSKPFFTAGGSFWSNSTTELLASTTEADRQARTRNRCNGEGYESVALIPLRAGERPLGLLQLNDRRKGRFSPDLIAHWERLAGYLAVALAKFQAEEALRESERKYRSLVDHAPVGVYRSNTGGTFLYVNEAMARIFECSVEEMLANPVLGRCKRRDDRQALIEMLKERGAISDYEINVPTGTGREKTIVITAALDGDVVTGMVMDITEQKKLEAQLRQAQKMEAIGTFAGGIAHDFNNILSAIVGYGNLLQMKMEEDNPLAVNVERILEAADRATALTHSMLAFSRKQVINPKPVAMNRLVRKVENFLCRIIGEDIGIQTTLGEEEMTVLADSGQIDQVLVNLAANARDAMPNGGTFMIETRRVELDESFISRHGYGKPGAYVLLTASDSGAGMDEETKSRVFEPFFTTKEAGRGTGLGLSVVYGIVKQHVGYIEAYSEPGMGSTFNIYLPLVDEQVEEEARTAGMQARPGGGKETILVAEDDAALRRVARVVLEDAGYTVIIAEDGEEALEKFIRNKGTVDLVVLDMVMPRKNGRETYEEMRNIDPDIKAIFASGYTANKVMRENLLKLGSELLLKPVAPRDLLRTVRQVLDRRC
jgi:PAS domain S-box-containing protein